jgi:hypothetical protein
MNNGGVSRQLQWHRIMMNAGYVDWLYESLH